MNRHPVGDAPDTSLKDVGDVELLADLAQVAVRRVSITRYRRAANDLEILDLDQTGKHVVLNAIREKGVLLVFAAVFERQNSDALLWYGRGFRWRRGEHFFKARVAPKWIPVRVQTQLVIPILSLFSRNLFELAQCGVALAGTGEKPRLRKSIRIARDFRKRGILPAHRRVRHSQILMCLLIAGVLLRFHLQDPPHRVERGIGTLLVPRIQMNHTFNESLRDHGTKSAVEKWQPFRRTSCEQA